MAIKAPDGANKKYDEDDEAPFSERRRHTSLSTKQYPKAYTSPTKTESTNMTLK